MTRVELEPLSRIAITISAYRSDDSVLSLLERLRSSPARFGALIIVDSMGSGRIAHALEQQPLPYPAHYFSAETNLGSAGNLAERLRLAGETSCAWAYCVNHDGDPKPERIAELLQVAERESSSAPKPVGAVYPLRRLVNRDRAYDVTGRFRVPVTAVRTRRPPQAETLPVHWSSSNGALYSLAPVRRGLLPWADLWMGYEDLGYGWLLERNGYRQLLASTVVVDDGYEYSRQAALWVTKKPAWYAYYYARNFLLVTRRTRQPGLASAAVWARVLCEYGAIALFRDEKAQRLTLLSQGILDAVRGRAGKHRLP